jgi:hypothetical protein
VCDRPVKGAVFQELGLDRHNMPRAVRPAALVGGFLRNLRTHARVLLLYCKREC